MTLLRIPARLVHCLACREDVTTDTCEPRCERCGGPLTAVCVSALTGLRVQTSRVPGVYP